MIVIRYLAPAALGALLVKAAEEQAAARLCDDATTGTGEASRLSLLSRQKERRPR